MREATALCQRVELRLAEMPESVIAGFHDDGRLSIYFGQETAVHFDDAGRLRRAFVDNHLYRSQGQTLARLTRSRSPGKTELLRYDLSPQELQEFLESLRSRLVILQDSLEQGTAQVVQQVPENAEVSNPLRGALERILEASLRLSPPLKR